MSNEVITYRTRQSDTADLIAFAYYGKTDGALEALLDANPGLADSEVLEAGIDIIMPVLSTAPEKTTTALWS